MPKILHDYVFGFADFPNKLAVTLYFTGCNLSCPYCYNMGVVRGRTFHSLAAVAKALETTDKAMMGQKVGVVFSGGEPTAHPEFNNVIDHFRLEGRELSLHTNGMTKFRDVFSSIVLSIKTSQDGVKELTKYRQSLFHIITEGCRNATYREIRIVDDVRARTERDVTVGVLRDVAIANNWRINKVKPQPTGGDNV